MIIRACGGVRSLLHFAELGQFYFRTHMIPFWDCGNFIQHRYETAGRTTYDICSHERQEQGRERKAKDERSRDLEIGLALLEK